MKSFKKLLCFLFSFFRTGLGRARAWLHLALMQKKVADYMKALLDRKDLLRLVTSVTFTFTPVLYLITMTSEFILFFLVRLSSVSFMTLEL